MKIASAKDLKIIAGLPPVAKKGDRIALDSEFFGQEKSRLHRPHGTFAYLGASYDGETVYYVTDPEDLQEFYQRIDAGVHIYHHAKYDVRQLRRFTSIPDRKRLIDTMLMEQIMFSGYYNDFSLADLVRRYLGVYMPKDVRKEFSDGELTEMTREQIEYACVDVAYTWRVEHEQRKLVTEDDMTVWREIELPFMWTLLDMAGIRLDVDKWAALAKKNQEIADEIQNKYGHLEEQEIIREATVVMSDDPNDTVGIFIPYRKKKKPIFMGVNLNSPKQVKDHFKTLGYNMASTDAEALEEIAEECEFAKDMLVYRTYAKRASTYGIKFIEEYVEADGKIYSDLYQIGAETGRTSCRAPNLQNQPHLPEYRECFIAGPDECIVVADWGSQEPRIAAFLSEDEGLKDALNSEEKLYIRVARDVLNISITKQDEEYKHMKSTVLGIFYGMSAKGLAAAIGVDEDTAQHYIDSFLTTYPGVEDYMKKQRKAKNFVNSIYGRKIWINKYSYQWDRNVLNAPIQSSAADAMKIAAARFRQEANPAWKIALLVHDEIAILGPKEDSDEMKKLLKQVMIDVAEEMHEGIRGSVEIFPEKDGEIATNWACKH